MICFIGFDQKPFYFNYNVASKALAKKGQKRIGIAESVAASRERFSGMSTVASWKIDTPSGVPPIGCMFKSKSNGRRIRGMLEHVDDVLLQFQQ